MASQAMLAERLPRAKVFSLDHQGQWEDQGTGFATIEMLGHAGSVPALVVVSEVDNKSLLVHRLLMEPDFYSVQGDSTIISWVDQSTQTDIAVSFANSEGCEYIVTYMKQLQIDYQHRKAAAEARGGAHFVPGIGHEAGMGVEKSIQFIPAVNAYSSAFQESRIPEPQMDNLEKIADLVGEVRQFHKDKVAQCVLEGEWLRKFIDIFRQAEDLEDLDTLHQTFKVTKSLIMLNDTTLLDALFSDDVVMDVIGCLEYDPEESERQHHRQYLESSVEFKEVIPFQNDRVAVKIHQTQKLHYLKDTILAKCLDDSTFQTISSLVLFNNAEVLNSLLQDAGFIPRLFGKLEEKGEGWSDLVAFLQELCTLSKQLQPEKQQEMMVAFFKQGFFDIITDVLEAESRDVRLKGMDILVSVLQHDPTPARTILMEKPSERLFGHIVQGIVDRENGGVQEVMLEVVRLLLDPESMENSAEKDEFLEVFYQKMYLGQLIEPLMDAAAHPGTVVLLIDLLIFCVHSHGYRIKYYIMRQNIMAKVMKLADRKEKWVACAAVRFLRACMRLKDEFYLRHVKQTKVFQIVFDAFLANGRRYNLLHSTILELMDFIRLESPEGIIEHLVETFGEELKKLKHISVFNQIVVKSQQMQEKGVAGEKVEGEAAVARAAYRSRMRPDGSMSREEEDYFNSEDGPEPDGQVGPPRPHWLIQSRREMASSEGAVANQPLVDYDSDDRDSADSGRSGDSQRSGRSGQSGRSRDSGGGVEDSPPRDPGRRYVRNSPDLDMEVDLMPMKRVESDEEDNLLSESKKRKQLNGAAGVNGDGGGGFWKRKNHFNARKR